MGTGISSLEQIQRERITDLSLTLLKKLAPYPGFSFGVSNVLEESTLRENYEALASAYKDFIDSAQ